MAAEERFSRLAKSLGWSVRTATRNENIYEHWDFEIKKGDKSFLVDVKGMKRLSRADTSQQDEWVWIELHGVRADDDGWLYNGKADFLAFETKGSFVLVGRYTLIYLVESLIDTSTWVSNSRDAKYKMYSRVGRPDVLTMIGIKDIKEVAWDEWVPSKGFTE